MHFYFKNSFVTLSYDRQLRLGRATWTGKLQGPELREAFLLCLEMINRYALTKWLADDRRMESISPADQEWSLQIHVPRMAGSSLQRYAWLPSRFDDNRSSVERMIDKGHTHDLNLVLRKFADEEEALAWLMEPL